MLKLLIPIVLAFGLTIPVGAQEYDQKDPGLDRAPVEETAPPAEPVDTLQMEAEPLAEESVQTDLATESDQELPRTAGTLPLLAVIGGASLIGAGGIHRLRARG